MIIRSIKNSLNAAVISGADKLDIPVKYIYASDLMSDVLAFGKPDSILLTGLATQQAVISAHVAEFKGVVFVRGKLPTDKSKDFANVHNLILLSTSFDMYDACLKIFTADKGIALAKKPSLGTQKIGEIILSQDFEIKGDDFANAGTISTEVKTILKKIGFDPKIIRRVAISTYEAELNVVMHAHHAKVNLSVTPDQIQVTIEDVGKGIPDIDLALKEGFTTATDEMRALGFGSGMGLPNIKRNTDDLKIESEVGKGTRLDCIFNIT